MTRLSDTISEVKDSAEQFYKVTVYFPGAESCETYKHVIDVIFGDGVIVLIHEEGCVYYRSRHVKKWTAVKEE